MANHRKDIKHPYLKELMDSKQVDTLHDASNATGIDATTLSRYNERGPKPTMILIAEEAKAWGVSPGEYLEGMLGIRKGTVKAT